MLLQGKGKVQTDCDTGMLLLTFGMAQAGKITTTSEGIRGWWSQLPERIGGAITGLIGLVVLGLGLIHTLR